MASWDLVTSTLEDRVAVKKILPISYRYTIPPTYRQLATLVLAL